MYFLGQLCLIRTESRPLLSPVILCFLVLGISLRSLQIMPNLFSIPATVRQLLSGVWITAHALLFKAPRFHILLEGWPLRWFSHCVCLQWNESSLRLWDPGYPLLFTVNFLCPGPGEAATATPQSKNPERNGIGTFMEAVKRESICSINFQALCWLRREEWIMRYSPGLPERQSSERVEEGWAEDFSPQSYQMPS